MLIRELFRPINILPLVYLRIAFGAIMIWEVWRYFNNGWIKRYYIDPEFYFSYFGFDGLRPLPGDGMYTFFYILGALAFCILIGAAYRIVMPLFFVGFSYVFLLDQTNYLNHFYMIALLSFLMIFLPANRAFAVDALWSRRRIASRFTTGSSHPETPRPDLVTPYSIGGLLQPSVATDVSPLAAVVRRWSGTPVLTAPAWTLYIIRFQIGIVYIFGGIAKLNGDWLRGEPMRMWLAARTDFPLIGQYFTEEWMVYAFSYGGLLLDLLAIPLLFHKWLRWPALVALLAFHLTNARLFSIGIFPWFMIAVLPLFFPLRWWDRLIQSVDSRRGDLSYNLTRQQTILVGFLALYAAFQILFPLRHFLYPGYVSWTEQGHKFSWHMKLRDKEGYAIFEIIDPAAGTAWKVTPEFYLTQRQTSQLAGDPEKIVQFAHFLADRWRVEHNVTEPIIRVYSLVSLNGREYQLLIDPSVNLVEKSRSLLAADWILPLEQPFRASTAAATGEGDME